MIAFCDIAPCSLTEEERRFRGAYCLHHKPYELLKRRYMPEGYHIHIRRRENLKLSPNVAGTLYVIFTHHVSSTHESMSIR
jgi:hypothetical protein